MVFYILNYSKHACKDVVSEKGYKGFLEVHGKIDTKQFYYNSGESDADTVHLQVNSIRFKPSKTAAWKNVLSLFLCANVKAYGKPKPVIHTAKKSSGKKQVIVRLQGIDAPELHYTAQSPGKKKLGTKKWDSSKFRQSGGAKSTWHLKEKIKEYETSGFVDATAITRIDSPNDPFDVYGRLVADIVITKNKKSLNINDWLLENGHAFPTFYDSMRNDEILAKLAKTKKAQNSKKNNLWKYNQFKIVKFDSSLTFKKSIKIAHDADVGDLNFPKIFRRQTQYSIGKKIGFYKEKNLIEYIKTKKDDEFFYTGDFLKKRHSLTLKQLGEIFKSGKINCSPEEIVIQEKSSDLIDKNGNKITSWN